MLDRRRAWMRLMVPDLSSKRGSGLAGMTGSLGCGSSGCGGGRISPLEILSAASSTVSLPCFLNSLTVFRTLMIGW